MTRDGNEASPARPRVFVVQPVMDVGRRALEEIDTTYPTFAAPRLVSGPA